ncbi:MAG: NAD(P)-binding protein [Arachnia sp.]
MSLVVHGATLSGLAAAARLARLGHDVVLVSDGRALGGRWAAVEGPAGHLVDAMPQLISLPATWRDVFKKSGGHLVAELNRAALVLVEAPPVRHQFPDGTSLELPAERGAQFHAVSHAFGMKAAELWRDVLDDLDQVWAARRTFGVNNPQLPRDKAERQLLWLDRSLTDLADRLEHPQLRRMIIDVGPINGTHSTRAPAMLATSFVLDRTFGRWQLVDDKGLGQRASHLVDLLTHRALERGVRIVERADEATTINCVPHIVGSWLHPAPRAAMRPAISHDLRSGEGLTSVQEIVDHTDTGPVTTWLRPVIDGVLASTHDHRDRTPDLAWGVAADNARSWVRRTPIIADVPSASSCSPAGNDAWAELASAALAVYEVHERLTGEDCRPTNRAFRGSKLTRSS